MVKDHINKKGLFQCFPKDISQKASVFTLPLKPKKIHIPGISLLGDFTSFFCCCLLIILSSLNPDQAQLLWA